MQEMGGCLGSARVLRSVVWVLGASVACSACLLAICSCWKFAESDVEGVERPWAEGVNLWSINDTCRGMDSWGCDDVATCTRRACDFTRSGPPGYTIVTFFTLDCSVRIGWNALVHRAQGRWSLVCAFALGGAGLVLHLSALLVVASSAITRRGASMNGPTAWRTIVFAVIGSKAAVAGAIGLSLFVVPLGDADSDVMSHLRICGYVVGSACGLLLAIEAAKCVKDLGALAEEFRLWGTVGLSANDSDGSDGEWYVAAAEPLDDDPLGVACSRREDDPLG